VTGGGSDKRRKAHVRNAMTANLFDQIAQTAEAAQRAEVKAFVKNINEKLQQEFVDVIQDIRTVICRKGEVSEAQRYPETATAMQKWVDHREEEQQSIEELISDLKGGVGIQQ
jgi:hypothetical protein